MDSTLGLNLLYVEDNPDLRDVISTILEGEGYGVSVAASASEGLKKLTEQRFHLVISDYALPDQTGAWMLREAVSAGLLASTEAVIVTAHPTPPDAGDVPVLQKPLDLDHFLRYVETRLARARRSEAEKAATHLDRAPLHPERPPRPKAELVLYVSSTSRSSLRALRNMDRVLTSFRSEDLAFTVCDLSKEVSRTAVEDRIAYTPTLVKRYPEPRAWIVGTLDDTGLVTDLLEHAGIERRK